MPLRSPALRILTVLILAITGFLLMPNQASATPRLDSPTDLPKRFPYQPKLAEPPIDLNDASIPRGSVPYHDIAPQLNDWMQQSNLISAQVVGQSTEGRDIHLVTLTAPESSGETSRQERWKDKIKNNAAGAAKDKLLRAGYKSPIWFNSNIHGNEWEGTDASMHYIAELLQNRNTPEVQKLLKTHRLYFTLSNNPDGRIAGTRATALGFDPNRDFVTNTLPETRIIRDLTDSLQPIFFSDLHGYTGVLQVEPTGPPHGENYEYDLFVPHAYASALRIQSDIVAADIPGNTYYDKATNRATTEKTGLIKIPYRDTPSGWDDWPPVFTAQYVAFQGAVASTVEFPLGRVADPATHRANGLINQEVALEVIKSTVGYITDNNADLVDNQIEIFRRGAAGEPLREIPANPDPNNYPGPHEWAQEWGADDVTGTEFPRAYVIPAGEDQRSATDAAYLVNFLLDHGIEVDRAKKQFTAGGTTYAKDSYIVDLHQPLRGLANALLAAGSDISPRVSSMYDISAWSQGYLWGADVDRIGRTTDSALKVHTSSVRSADATGEVPHRKRTHLSFELQGVDNFRGLNALLSRGVEVSMTPQGTAVIGPDPATRSAASAVAKQYGVAFSLAEAPDDQAKPLSRLTVGWTGSRADDLTSLKLMGFEDDQLVPVTAAAITSGEVDLSTIDVLWLGGTLTFNAQQSAGADKVRAYLDSGKGFVGRGAAANDFANRWLNAGSTAVAGAGAGNGIVALDTEAGGALGHLDTEWGFVSPALSFSVARGEVLQRYAAVADPDYPGQGALLAGHWRRTTATNGPDFVVGRASAYSARDEASGAKGMVFGTSPLYRTHPRGHFSEVLTGLYWAAPDPAGAQAAISRAAVEDSVSPESLDGATPTSAPSEAATPSPAPTGVPETTAPVPTASAPESADPEGDDPADGTDTVPNPSTTVSLPAGALSPVPVPTQR